MTQEQFLEQFAQQFEETDPSTIQLGTNFREIEEWSSMMALVVIAMVDSEYGIKLTGDDIRNSNTVEDLYKVVSSK